MKLFYNASNTNFGDHLNAWLWPRLIPGLLEREDDLMLIGIGSLLKADIDRLPGRKVIFGTGSGYGPPPPPGQAGHWQVYAVRGPLTARIYDLPSATAITDGAWLIDRLPEWRESRPKGGGTVFVPHWTSAAYGNWPAAAARAGIGYVDPLDDGPSVLERIARADLVIAESLHAAIFADYFRTPWIPAATGGRVLHFKWLDWCLSLDLPYRSYPLPPSDFTDALVQGARPSHRMPEPVATRFVPEQFRYSPVAARSGAGPLYRAKTRAKGVARQTRTAALNFLERHRDRLVLRRWNDDHRDALAGYLDSLAAVEPQLSTDRVRADRLDRLAAALQDMRGDMRAAA